MMRDDKCMAGEKSKTGTNLRAPGTLVVWSLSPRKGRHPGGHDIYVSSLLVGTKMSDSENINKNK